MQSSSTPVRVFVTFLRLMAVLMLAALPLAGAPSLPATAAPSAEVVAPAPVAPLPVEPAPLRSGPQLILTKTVDDNVTEAQVGDVIRYRIRWECSSLTTACGQMEITDTLQAGLTYLPPPNSSVPGGFEITYNGGTRTITIIKSDNNLLDGTQYDAVIAVRVNNDLRPLPGQIDNTVNGRIRPTPASAWVDATPAHAPPIAIGAVSPSWELTKTRVAPVIEPTVDTDVTYRLQLCPVPPPSGGIADLTNITLTDTLPTGAVFVSASNSGAYNEGTGVVTWPTVAGPLAPPDCITRFVTMRYPSPPFSLGDDLTNEAEVTASYTDSDDDSCPDCFGDPVTEDPAVLIDIVDVPTYSKSDAGDPVGITGTARFILNLNTNLTNYPANDVVLIDNMPPQLQVTSVTSGTWSEDFDYVRAYVEYSNNGGTTWINFDPLEDPVLYNTNATYVAPVNNITNVRWRFEHDWDDDGTYVDGLPYVWQFTSNPEIRSTPRPENPPVYDGDGNLMPHAEVGQTYTNCLYITRTDSSGPVSDPCDNENITVQGDFASLRVSKDETPGTPWDEWEDPNINDFTADATLLPGDTLRYVLRVELTERSSAPLINPTILDTLPADLVFVRAGDVRVNGDLISTAYPAAVVNFTNSQPSGNPGANQTLQWQITNLTIDELELGSEVLTVEFFARIPRGQLPGARTNSLFVDTASEDVICETGTERANGCETTDTYIVERSAALRGEKWIRSVAVEPLYNSVVVNKDTFLPDASCPDGGTAGMTTSTNTFTRFPCISQAYPEDALSPTQHVGPADNPLLDDFEYQLRIFNDGNVDMLNYWLYDILPYFGDRGSGGTLSNTDRDSEFRPVLTGPVEFLGGAGLAASDFTINYSLSTNPCRPQVFNQGSGSVPAGCDNTWLMEAAVTDWSAVRAYRVLLLPGSSIAPYDEVASNPETNILRFGVPMSIPADSPLVGVFNNDDAQSREIAWNSFSHVGSYQDLSLDIRDLLASEPRKVGITIPERFSIGNRVWRDSDNSGTINPPDDTDPGIQDVLVHLYLASNTTTPIATTRTDSGGYYLFSNLPAGDYVVGIPAVNFDEDEPLYTLRSSTGTPPDPIYTNSPLDANPDSSDHGIDPAVLGNEVFSPVINLASDAEPVNETDLSENDRDGPAGTRRGVNGELDENSDLTVDFGFFGGSDVPFSIGNHVWFDNGAGANLNNGIFDADEVGVPGARVELYRDGNLDGILDSEEMIRWDTTDAGGFYLFDNLDPGTYYVLVPAVNFQDGGVLAGWYSSQGVGDEIVGVIDGDDNGIDADFPEDTGVRSGAIVLERGVDTPLGESHFSGDTSIATGFNPTAGDGPLSIGRFGETDATSNMTIDFGFIPPMSLGNRVWIDDGAGEAVFRSQYNNGVQDGTEAGVAGVRVELWRDVDPTDGDFDSAVDELLDFTPTDAQGYYLFERLQPGDYFVHISSSNFASGQPLNNYISSFDRLSPADDATDMNDNGIDAADPVSTGVTSPSINMSYRAEPLTPANETDISANPIFGPDNRGTYGQLDANSNLTIDFGFVLPPRSIGNHLWYDEGAGANTNNRIRNGGELPVSNARVSLYRDDNNDGTPDDLGVLGDPSDDWIAYDITDSNGFYLFDNLPPGRYLVGVDNTNFQSGNPLFGYASSVGTLTDNDERDNGIDRIMPYDAGASPYGILSATIDMRLTATIPTGESHLSNDTGTTLGFNPTEDDGPDSRGRFGETDANSNLRIDFGFFRPMSLGNRVFYDNGAGTNLNNGIMDGDEIGVPGVSVELYRDINNNGVFDPSVDSLVNSDTTDDDGYYLFDRLVPGNYFVHIPASNFDLAGTGPLRGWHNSTPTGTETLGVNGGTTTADIDRDDNGVNNAHPAVNGITSGLVVLAWTTEPTGETELSGQANPGAGNAGFNPTGWDGPESRGRWGELDANSNLTIDFGFIPPLSLGNRVWLDDGRVAAGHNLLSQFDNGIMDDTEVGFADVLLELYYDANNDDDYLDTVDGVDEFVPYRTTTTDANGHYLFDGLPEGRFYVRVAPSNFESGGALYGYRSSTGVFDDETGDQNDNGIDDVDYLTNGIRSRNFVLQYGSPPMPIDETDIPANTPANVTAYGADRIGRFGEVNANSNLTLDFGFVRPHSIGNRVWRDADNSGTINAPDDLNPGIGGVLVHLYRDDDQDGIPDDVDTITGDFIPIATTTTDSAGFYLFDNLPAGDYVVGIPASNFASGAPLEALRSSTGTPSSATYTNPPITNPDRSDHGIDPPPGEEVFSATLTLGSSEPTTESDLPANTSDNRTLYGPDLRGRYGERNQDSNLTVDFGFFGGTDVPFSIGNHVWFDDGVGITAGVPHLNNGIFDTDEVGVSGVRVELYRDGSGDNLGRPDPEEFMRFDITDANGFYLFDNLDPGTYFVWVTPGNFQDTFDPDGAGPLPVAPGPLAGWYSSQSTFADAVDQNDNGIDTNYPETHGVWSNPVTLTRGTSTPTGETHLSGDTSSAVGFNPTAGDGPESRGRFGETDATSDLTIDFGFIPPLSLGNRVWFDSGADEPDFRSQYNDGVQNGTEVGVGGVRVELWRGSDFLRDTTTDSEGYYLFDRLQPGDYTVRIPAINFTGVGPLVNYVSSFDRVPRTDNNVDRSDKGIDVPDPATTGVTSPVININYGAEPTDDDDISSDATRYGSDGIGLYGQVDANSNLTADFGFVRAPRSIGNYLWFDIGVGTNTNNGIFDSIDELPVSGALVSLYRDEDDNGEPDGLAIAWDVTDSNGYYLFDNLPPGRYLVGVDAENFATGGTYTALVGYTSSTGHVDNAVNNLDSRDNGIDVLNPTLSYGVLSTTIDLTAVPLTGIPTGETGSGNTSMVLGFNPTAGDGINSRGRFGETDGNSDLTIDFGFTYAYALGNRVWYDTNNDSEMNTGEQPIENVRVELYRADNDGDPIGTAIDSTVTNAGGYYLFDYLAPGNYVVVLPASNFTAVPLIGYWSSGESMQADGTTTESESRDPNAVATYNDDRRDNGMRTTLADFNGAVISKMVTLGPGEFSEPDGETDLDGGSQGNQPDERANMTVDFGFYRVAVGDLVFRDLNKNGAFDDGVDTPIVDVTVRLYASDGVTEIEVGPDGILGTADDDPGGMVTNASGQYLFTGLPAGDYIIRVDGPAGSSSTFDLPTAANPDNNENNDDNGIGTGEGTVSSAVFSLTAGSPGAQNNNVITNNNGTTYNPTLDFGFVTAYALGNRVWYDTNNNSEIDFDALGDPIEQGVKGVLVELYFDDGSGNPGLPVMELDGVTQRTAVTADGGYYLFDYLDAGNYVVVIPASNFNVGEALHGYWSSGTSRNDDGSLTEIAALDPDDDEDSDDNGTLRPSGAVVSLPVTLGGATAEPIGESDVDTTLPLGSQQGAQPDNRANMTVDFGFYRVDIGNLVFRDENVNGTFDAGDTRLGGVTVQLLSGDGLMVLDTVTTDAITITGEYRFSGQPEGNYIVRVQTPSGHVSTIDTANLTDTTDPNTNIDNNDNGIGIGPGTATNVTSGQFTMDAGDTGAQGNNDVTNNNGITYNPTLDFGFTYAYALGNRVWFDTNNNSEIDFDALGDPIEQGVDGVLVELYLASDLTTVLATDTTANGGYYLFDNLTAGDYVVAVAAENFVAGGSYEELVGYWSSGTTRDTDGSLDESPARDPNDATTYQLDSRDNGELNLHALLPDAVASRAVTLGLTGLTEPTGESDVNSLAPGTDNQGLQPDGRANMTVDFGFYKVAVGDLVWADADRDGAYQDGEPLLPGVTVNLYASNADGTVTTFLESTTTVNGLYRFDNLPAGTYVISVIAPDGTFSTRDDNPPRTTTMTPITM
jgi:fimbrial isopeptide formation D2 family protein